MHYDTVKTSKTTSNRNCNVKHAGIDTAAEVNYHKEKCTLAGGFAMLYENYQENLFIEERMRRNILLEKEGKMLVDTLPLPIKQEVLNKLKENATNSEQK